MSIDISGACNIITFSDADYKGINPDHNQALVITLDISNHDVKKTLVDNGSSVDVLFAHTLDRMQLGSLRLETSKEQSLYGFGHNVVPIQGIIHLPVIFGTEPRKVRHMVKFYVINIPSSYNAILGRLSLTKLRAITSTPHLKVKFSTPKGVGELKAESGMAETCYGAEVALGETSRKNKRKSSEL